MYIFENVKKKLINVICLCDIKKERNGNLFFINSIIIL